MLSEAALEMHEARSAPTHHCDGKVPAKITVITGYDIEVAQWVRSQLEGINDFGPCTALGIARDDQIIVGVVYSNYHKGLNGHGGMIEGSIAATDPRWCTRDTIRLFLHYPFRQLGVRRFQATVAKRNKKARRFIERLGFVYEGTGRRAWSDARDACVYSMLPEEATRWLGDIDGQEHAIAAAAD